MNERAFRMSIVLIAASFSAYFLVVVIPPLLEDPDIFGALRAGFVNPYSSGYSADVLGCWAILAVWVIYEAKTHAVRGGWICLIAGAVPGVAVGLAAYLILRSNQLRISQPRANSPDAA